MEGLKIESRKDCRETKNKAKEIFLREVKRRLPESQAALAYLEENGYDPQKAEIVYKFAHTLKGSGEMVGVWEIADPAVEMTVALLLIEEYGVKFGDGPLRFLIERMEEIGDYINNFQQEQDSPVVTITSSQRKKILVVDDDRTVTELVAEGLSKKGFEVTVCYDSRSAGEYLLKEQPDLIVLDIILPDVDGISFCRKIRSTDMMQIVPIIFLTVKDTLQDKLAGFSTGADDYLCKPFKIQELEARIRAILNRVDSIKDLILQDDLTKAYNRRYLEITLKEEIARARRANGNFSVAMLDVDFFKEINDRYGHAMGDEVLQCLVQKITASLRSTDIVCRYGGEEFVIVLPGTTLPEARPTLERLRGLFADEPLYLTKNQRSVSITISVGGACFPRNGSSAKELLKAADYAMYRAKEAGRNRVSLSTEGKDDGGGA